MLEEGDLLEDGLIRERAGVPFERAGARIGLWKAVRGAWCIQFCGK